MKFHHSSRPNHPEDDPLAPNWTHLNAHSDETTLASERTSDQASERASESVRSPDFIVDPANNLATKLATDFTADLATDLATDLTIDLTTDLTDFVTSPDSKTLRTTPHQPQIDALSPTLAEVAEVPGEISEAIETSMLNPSSPLPTSPPGKTTTDEMNGYLKEHFFRLMSQEYRTLLSTILMSAEVLEAEADELDTEERVMYEQQIRTAAEHMKNLLNEATENF